MATVEISEQSILGSITGTILMFVPFDGSICGTNKFLAKKYPKILSRLGSDTDITGVLINDLLNVVIIHCINTENKVLDYVVFAKSLNKINSHFSKHSSVEIHMLAALPDNCLNITWSELRHQLTERLSSNIHLTIHTSWETHQ